MLCDFQDWVIKDNVAFVSFTRILTLGAWNCHVRSSITMISWSGSQITRKSHKQVLYSTALVALPVNSHYQLLALWVSHLKYLIWSSLPMIADSLISYSNCLRDPKPEPSHHAFSKFLTQKNNEQDKIVVWEVICYTIVARMLYFRIIFTSHYQPILESKKIRSF